MNSDAPDKPHALLLIYTVKSGKVLAVIEVWKNLRTMFKIHCQLRCRYNGEPDRDDDRIPLLYQSKNIVRRKTYFKVIVLL